MADKVATGFVAVLTVAFSLASCGGGSVSITGVTTGKTGADSEIKVVREQVISLEAQVNNSGGAELKYQWSSLKGAKFTREETDSPANIYQAPAETGPDLVTVRALLGGRRVAEKSVEVRVVDSPSSPPQPAGGAPAQADRDTPPGPTPKISSVSPRPETCASMGDCTVTVEIAWQPSQGRILNLFIRPLPSHSDQSYWAQTRPERAKGDLWVAGSLAVGQASDPEGTPFRICAVAATRAFPAGVQMGQMPPGPSGCIDVTRGRR